VKELAGNFEQQKHIKLQPMKKHQEVPSYQCDTASTKGWKLTFVPLATITKIVVMVEQFLPFF
jgi:hypothetical protein